jgi:hypothetical protein
MVLAVVLLVAWYASSVGTIFVVGSAGWLPQWAKRPAYVYMTPWMWYIQVSQWPGAEQCGHATMWCEEMGHRLRKQQ